VFYKKDHGQGNNRKNKKIEQFKKWKKNKFEKEIP
jgi:hypothetical protein